MQVKHQRFGGARLLAMGLSVVMGLSVFGMVLLGRAAPASAQSATVTYNYLVGSGLLCSLSATACPDIARASNGDTVEISGQGTFVTGSDNVTGGGTFVHKDSTGTVKATGTWAAEDLLSFTSFGGNAPGLPANFEGGLARIDVELHPSGSNDTFEAVLQVDCGINSPTGAEGVKLAVEDSLNFDQEVSGFTVFINNGPAEGDN